MPSPTIRDQQSVLRSEQVVTDKACGTGEKVECMQAAGTDFSGNGRNHKGIERRNTILDSEHDADPVPRILIRFRRCIRSIPGLDRDRWGGVNPHDEQTDPGEELHNRQAFHH